MKLKIVCIVLGILITGIPCCGDETQNRPQTERTMPQLDVKHMPYNYSNKNSNRVKNMPVDDINNQNAEEVYV